MNEDPDQPIRSAEVVLPCADLDETLEFFTATLGFRLVAIFPADDPEVAVVSGHGLTLRLDRAARGDPGVLRLLCRDPATLGNGASVLRAPNGTRIELAPADPPLVVPAAQPAFVLTRCGDDARWLAGRAGMLYRDLLPDRLGGRFIASHIRIPDGGPVPDYVHFHAVRFQLIFCARGWVRVVYEDQGPPFVLRAGDAVLQPPRIRHRVLECSPGLEVVEITCPAQHATLTDPELLLPTNSLRPERRFDGQRFVRHEAEAAPWTPWRLRGFTCQDFGLSAATGGLATARVVRAASNPAPVVCSHDAGFLFTYLLAGRARIACEGHGDHDLEPGACVVVPAGRRHVLTSVSDDLQLLEVALPADFATTLHADESPAALTR